jgi:predicted RNA-binding protein with PIN domain
MILLIDAYNVLKQIIATDQATPQEKTAFITVIKQYARVKKVSVELIFDGGRYGLPDCVRVENVTICHSGAQEIADDVIKALIQAYKGREVLLVSTDRELGRYAIAHGVEVLDSADFYRLVQEALDTEVEPKKQVSTQLIKTTKTQQIGLDELMAEYTVTIKKGFTEEKKVVSRALGRGKLSKRERLLEKKIRKL